MSNSLSSINSIESKHQSLDIPIYKVKQLVNGSVNTIYVFNGKTTPENEATDVKFSEQQIHFDDSISSIKIKILNELKKSISLDEIYLFCRKIETLNAVSVYKSLTQNNKLILTKIRLQQFVSNIISDENGNPFPQPEDKDVYTFDDIFQMNFDNKKYIVNKVLGQKFFIVENEYPFVCNPYDVKEYDKFFEKSARKSLTTLNSHLLLNSGKIIDNSIYVCLAEDVLSYLNKKDISEETTIKIYYPFLYDKNINNIDDIGINKPKLIESTKRVLNDRTTETFKTIDMFYNVYNFRKNELNYVNKGVKFIKFVIKPEFSIKIPLEIIFKIIHATQENPLIKYNPSSRQENVYRLFTDKIATDGRKIPYLKKANIFKLMKNIGHGKSVAVYVESSTDGDIQSLICEFDEEGYITVSSEFKSIVSVDKINIIFKDLVNPIIIEIQNVLEQSGYKLKNFNSLNDENVEIKQLTYETKIQINRPLDIQTYKGCISSIFINETNAFKGNEIQLRFKRVANYSKFTSQEAFILEKSEQGLRGDQIIEALIENFPDELDKKQAIEMVSKVANELEIERGARKSDIKIKNSPGFKTTINLENETGIITITTENINSIGYLQTLPIYLDTMVRLTQDKSSTNYPVKEITYLCSSGDKEDVIIDDIISLSEESAPNSEVPSIEPGDDEVEYAKYKFVDTNKPKGALSLFFDEDENENENEEPTFEGGQPSSESSISSEEFEKSKNPTYSGVIVQNGISSSQISESSIETNKSSSLSDKNAIESPKKLESFGISSEPEQLKTPVIDSESSEPSEPEQLKTPVIVSESSEPSEPEQLKTPVIDSETSEPSEPESYTKEIKKSVTIPTSPLTIKTSSESKILAQNVSEIPTLIPKSSSESEVPHELLSQKSLEKSISAKVSSSESQQSAVKLAPTEEISSEKTPESDEEDEDVVRNIDGMKLNKPYYFQTLIENKDPVLILKEDTPQFNSYVRTCSSSMRKQPVILTDSQLDKINKEHPGFLREEDIIKYGSNPKNQNNYICPRYWCLKNNTIVDPKELKEVTGKDGKKELMHPTCGKVLPKGEKVVKPGYYIYEFYKPKPGKKDYKKYPGLITDSHPDGLCLPCCFDKYNTEGRIIARKKCYGEKLKEDDENKEKKEESKQDEYIKGPDKFPLEPGRWGYLQGEIQTMLHEVNADCQISKTNTNIKDNHPCLLRHGVEVNDKQSFIACLSDALFFGKRIVDENNKLTKKTAKILSIKEMRERIIQSLTIDSFIKYQNGNLITDFYDIDKKVDINKYSNSKLYSKLNMDKPEDKAYYIKVVSAFENFKNYLNDNDAFIDHTYLWDIVCMPNKYLFPDGVNLVIFQLPNDDITNNVSILCPSNHYSSEFYETRKPTIMLIKEEGYYEPIYTYTTNNKNINVTKEFKERDPKLSKTMRAVFKEIIKPFFNLICRPLDSMPNVYKAKRPLILYDLVQKLDKYEYKIIKQVMNFNGKVIGVLAEEPNGSDRKGFIPCYPSSLDEDLKKELSYVFMNDLTLWNNYKDTVQFLNKLTNRSKKRRDEPDIPCKPAFKIIEDEHVVGILTNTNQFIQLSKPIRQDEIEPELDLPSITNNNYIVDIKSKPMVSSEIDITTKNDVDKERVDYIKKIKLETNFYNVFRNTIRILINSYENIKIREKIEDEMSKEYIIYSEKLEKIDRLLRELVKDKIQFIGDDNYYKLINEVSSCIVKDKKACSDTPNLCAVTENGKCNLILPNKNLITNKVNEPIYYGRMSDEFIRYNRIKSFMLQPQTYLSFGNVGYNLRDNEIILIQSLLTQEYFENLIPAISNKYIKHNSYDEVKPIITQTYENVIPSLDHAIGRKNIMICDKNINGNITSTIWKKCFPKEYYEIEYSKFNFCTFNFIIDLIERKTNTKLTINQVKNELFEEYKKYIVEYSDKIIDILILEGKKTLGDQVHNGTLSFSSLIYTDNYFLTTFDLWLLVTKYKIPTIFICNKWMLQTQYQKREFVGYGNLDDKFAFVVIPGLRPENVPGYKLIQSTAGDVFISIKKLDEECLERIRVAIEHKTSIEDYLRNFVKPIQYVKRKPRELIIETDSEEPKPEKPKKIIIENTTPISQEENVIELNKKKSKKKLNVRETKNKSVKRGQKKRRLLIIDSSDTEKI